MNGDALTLLAKAFRGSPLGDITFCLKWDDPSGLLDIIGLPAGSAVAVFIFAHTMLREAICAQSDVTADDVANLLETAPYSALTSKPA